MVHDLKPPFLDGKTKFTTQLDQITVVKDQNSDMAILAKKGSAVLKALR
jgi:pre-mRNA-splicing factor ATP-dependent RNA helicase DHX38/PRP16